MMIACISDIHSNKDALKRVLCYLRGECITKIYCLGDLIGYGDYPSEVIEALQGNKVVSLMGNHERLLLNGIYPPKYNMPYTKRVLSKEALAYLRSLPSKIVIGSGEVLFAHTIPVNTDNYLYVNSDFSCARRIPQKYVFIGHTHYPALMSYYSKVIINPGSVGQPRDGDCRASLVLCDLKKGLFKFIRV